ncbi:uncharacterized protein [Clinocottus analis]|uniref:uncharacterized protein n=1 Tax=Clinocottus analis TaxID=304258 RepID=UPI0035BF5F5D
MKRHCVPLRADHTLSGVIQVRLGGVASHSGHLSDSFRNASAVGSSGRRPAASPTRRLRFEDETETEAESRYLERRGGQRGTGVLVSRSNPGVLVSRSNPGVLVTRSNPGVLVSRSNPGVLVSRSNPGVLVSRPNLNHYVHGRAGHVDGQHRGHTLSQCNSCGTVLGLNLNLRLQPPAPENQERSLHRPHLNLRTEPIRETHIDSITPGERGERAGRVGSSANQVELNENQMTVSQATPTTALPINPYAPDQLTTHTTNRPSSWSPPSVTSPKMSQNIRLNSTRVGRDSPAAEPHRPLRSGAEGKDRSPSEEEGGLDLRMKISSSETTAFLAESQVSSSDGQVRQPMRAELHKDDPSVPECLISRDEPSRLSLRRLFSNVRLSRTRTGSLNHLGSRPRTVVSDPALLGSRKYSSVQSLSVGSPFLQLRKSSSVESFVLEQKKPDRSTDYRPAADHLLQRCLSIDDVGRPSSVRSVGRVLQVCSDGTFLLEVSQPNSQMYGFVISRGRGRSDSGVYVEDMVDSSTKKLYTGLLAVGDEILEVNGQKVACLSLDQVTLLLTQSTSATIRVLRHR